MPEEKQGSYEKLAEPINPENPVDEKQQKHLRKLDDDDLAYFRSDFCHVVVWFIESVTQNLEGALSKGNWDLLLDMTYERNYEQMVKLEKESPAELDKVLSVHFVTGFMLDILQFCFAFFVVAKPINSETPKREIYDHRLPLDP